MSALFDFPSLLVVILLFICSTAYLRSLYPTIFDSTTLPNETSDNMLTPNRIAPHHGIKGFCWKASRVGERLSPYVSVFCIAMALQILFFKD